MPFAFAFFFLYFDTPFSLSVLCFNSRVNSKKRQTLGMSVGHPRTSSNYESSDSISDKTVLLDINNASFVFTPMNACKVGSLPWVGDYYFT